MAGREEVARRAVEAGDVAAQAVNNYGIDSQEAYGALIKANEVLDEAQAAGCTKADFDQAHRRR